MLHGTLELEFEDGTIDKNGFCGRAVVDDPTSDEPRLRFFQGWRVSNFTECSTSIMNRRVDFAAGHGRDCAGFGGHTKHFLTMLRGAVKRSSFSCFHFCIVLASVFWPKFVDL